MHELGEQNVCTGRVGCMYWEGEIQQLDFNVMSTTQGHKRDNEEEQQENGGCGGGCFDDDYDDDDEQNDDVRIPDVNRKMIDPVFGKCF